MADVVLCCHCFQCNAMKHEKLSKLYAISDIHFVLHRQRPAFIKFIETLIVACNGNGSFAVAIRDVHYHYQPYIHTHSLSATTSNNNNNEEKKPVTTPKWASWWIIVIEFSFQLSCNSSLPPSAHFWDSSMSACQCFQPPQSIPHQLRCQRRRRQRRPWRWIAHTYKHLSREIGAYSP